MNDKTLNRRHLFKKASLVAGAIGATSLHAVGQMCAPTVEQPEGPFYPIRDQLDKDNDLTQISGNPNSAEGQIVFLRGVVTIDRCLPVAGALVEIWQACHTGKYNHPGDPNPAELDRNFQYWGRTVTNQKGEYLFKTIKPGSYQANATWERPPHIHMKVHLRGFHELTTQIYFAEEQDLNDRDLILRQLSTQDQNDVLVDFQPNHRDELFGTFNISLNRI